MLRALLLLAAACPGIVPGFESSREAPRELRIVAQIDGVDELHISHAKASWVHRAFDMPSAVSINGQSWDLARGLNLDANP